MYVSTVLFEKIPPIALKSCLGNPKVFAYEEEVQSLGSSLCKIKRSIWKQQRIRQS